MTRSTSPWHRSSTTTATGAGYEAAGMCWLLDNEQPVELHGHSCFLRDRDSVFHTYSMYARAARRSAAPTTSWT